jgi:5'-3' exonuclease
MNQPLLVLDVSYLCYRAFYSTGGLSHGEKPTGVIFGFLKTISLLKEEFQTDRIAFCFEHPHLLRKDVFPEYKQKRKKEKTPEEMAAYKVLRNQIDALQNKYLTQIGFKNVFSFDGYEADDIMAIIAADTPDDEECILVTADGDLLQCLSDNVSIYCPQSRKLITEASFIRAQGIRPSKWAIVKAIAGCAGDGVPGIKGVGEVGAIKYIKKQLPERTMQYQAITSEEGIKTILRNRWLVELPYANCPSPKIQNDKVSSEGWKTVCAELGFKSMAGMPPIHVRTQGRLKL